MSGSADGRILQNISGQVPYVEPAGVFHYSLFSDVEDHSGAVQFPRQIPAMPDDQVHLSGAADVQFSSAIYDDQVHLSGEARVQSEPDGPDHLSRPAVPVFTADGRVTCPDSGGSYKNLKGLGVHRNRKHGEIFHQERLTAFQPKKPRWTTPEEHRMASLEAQLRMMYPADTNINQLISSHFEGRTFESIKSKRKDQAYKDKVQEHLAQLQEVDARDSPPDAN